MLKVYIIIMEPLIPSLFFSKLRLIFIERHHLKAHEKSCLTSLATGHEGRRNRVVGEHQARGRRLDVTKATGRDPDLQAWYIAYSHSSVVISFSCFLIWQGWALKAFPITWFDLLWQLCYVQVLLQNKLSSWDWESSNIRRKKYTPKLPSGLGHRAQFNYSGLEKFALFPTWLILPPIQIF